jgi:hypothetical protein
MRTVTITIGMTDGMRNWLGEHSHSSKFDGLTSEGVCVVLRDDAAPNKGATVMATLDWDAAVAKARGYLLEAAEA